MTSNGQANTNTVNLKVSYSASRTGELEFMEACADTCNVTYVWVEFPFVPNAIANFEQLCPDWFDLYPPE
jgi:hypothetical protein